MTMNQNMEQNGRKEKNVRLNQIRRKVAKRKNARRMAVVKKVTLKKLKRKLLIRISLLQAVRRVVGGKRLKRLKRRHLLIQVSVCQLFIPQSALFVNISCVSGVGRSVFMDTNRADGIANSRNIRTKSFSAVQF